MIVEQLAGWEYGEAIFETPMIDDWHLVRAMDKPHLVRIRDDSQGSAPRPA